MFKIIKNKIDELAAKEFEKHKDSFLEKYKDEETIIRKEFNDRICKLNQDLLKEIKFQEDNKKELFSKNNTQIDELMSEHSRKVEGLKIELDNQAKALLIEKDKYTKELESLNIEKRKELDSLNVQLSSEIEQSKQLRVIASEEQKQLWEKLDILKNNLNTQDVWSRLWECAYSKAVDMVWDIQKKENLKLIEIAREEGRTNGIEGTRSIYEQRISNMIAVDRGIVNIPLLLKKKDEINANYLKFQRIRDLEKEKYYKAQMDLIGEVVNEKV